MEIGLATTFLAVPSSVLRGVMGPYDEPKVWALVALIGLTGVAWLAGRTRGSSPTLTSRPDGALRLVHGLLAAYGIWWGLATALSLAPGQSLWGGLGRAFGLAAFAATLALFAIVQTEIRVWERACRLVDVALIGSIPVVAMAIGQALGWDPLPAGWDPATADLRVRSTFGQHIFLGSYLVALIPLGIGRVVIARGQREPLPALHLAVTPAWALGMIGVLGVGDQGPLAWWGGLAWSAAGAVAWTAAPAGGGLQSAWRVALVGSLVAAQAVALMLSTARGALIGLLVGLATALTVLLAVRRARRTIAVVGTGVALVVLLVVVLNLGGSPLDRLKGIPLFARLGSMAQVQEGSPGWVRVRLWQGILSRWVATPPSGDAPRGLASPLRGLVGYGPDTQILVLDRFLPADLRALPAAHRDWRALYAFDRAHNELLDHLLTVGVVGLVLWLGVLGAVVVTGVRRLRSSRDDLQVALRAGCLAAVVGQAVEGLVGIASPMPRALFWMAAAILTAPSPMGPAPGRGESRDSPVQRKAVARPRLPRLALLAGALVLAVLVTTGSTRSLLGSMAYAAGIRHGIAGDLMNARREFLRASHLAPWTPFPAEAAADVSLRLIAATPSVAPGAAWLQEAQEALARSRAYVGARSDLWRLSGQLRLAWTRAGHPEQLDHALHDFSEAARLRPGDPHILAQWALALVQSGDPDGARKLAEEALASDRMAWLAWAVLARSYSQLGNHDRAQASAAEARRLVPGSSRDLAERLLR